MQWQVRQVQQRYEVQLRDLAEALERRHGAEVAAVEARRSEHVGALLVAHDKAFAELREYYQGVTTSNLDLIKALKARRGGGT